MDGITLLREAWGAGLTVRADGDRLVIRGPQKAETVAKRLLDNKATVLDALRTNGLPDGVFEPAPDLPAAPATGSAPDPEPGGTYPASGIGGSVALDPWRARQHFSTWVQRSNGRGRPGWEPADLPEEDRWWAEYDCDELPAADWNCPQCGGLLWWEDPLGGKHCLRCQADKAERADRLAAKAARLRRRNPPPTEHPSDRRKPAPQERPQSTEADPADLEHVGRNSPSQGLLGGFSGV